MALSFDAIEAAADSLGVEPCAVKAIVEVESAGSGFIADGRVKILFEGHVFWKQLQQRRINPAPLASKYPGILYPKWTKAHYRGPAGEWVRLEEAKTINLDAALCSASWGLFQIMGFHYNICGFQTVADFVAAQAAGEEEQLKTFCSFMQSEGLVRFLAAKDWAVFAKRYNGPGYAANHYDKRLASAYERCKK